MKIFSLKKSENWVGRLETSEFYMIKIAEIRVVKQ